MVFAFCLLSVGWDYCWWEGMPVSGMGCLLMGRDACQWERMPSSGMGGLLVGLDGTPSSGILYFQLVLLLVLVFVLAIMRDSQAHALVFHFENYIRFCFDFAFGLGFVMVLAGTYIVTFAHPKEGKNIYISIYVHCTGQGFGFTGLWDSGLTFCADISYNVVFDLAIPFSYTFSWCVCK